MNSIKRPIFLDFQSTTPLYPEVLDRMIPFFNDKFGNPHSSFHTYGIESRDAIEQARQQIADVINASPDEVIFCSGATEANNLAISQLSLVNDMKRVITTKTEHKCILESCDFAHQQGAEVEYIEVNQSGLIDFNDLEEKMSKGPSLVSIMMVNNETGVIQDMEKIGHLCEKYNSILHTDAAQAIGKIGVDVKSNNILAMSLSAHKFCGPKGIGVFYIDQSIKNLIEPLIRGGGQEYKIRSGTLATPLVVGMGFAAEISNNNLEDNNDKVQKLREAFLEKFSSNVSNFKINGDLERRITSNINIQVDSVESDQLMMNVPQVAFSSGSACSTGNIEASHVLRAMGFSVNHARESFRISFSPILTLEEVIQAAELIALGINKLKSL